MKNKKGFNLLGEHVVNLIVAVLCIVVLLGLGAILFNFFRTSQEFEQAKSTLLEVESSIKNLKSVGQFKEVQILNPTDWWVSVWPTRDIYPPACGNFACICISKEIYLDDWKANKYTCVKISDKTLSLKTDYLYRLLDCDADPESSYKIDPPLSLKITLLENNKLYLEELC